MPSTNIVPAYLRLRTMGVGISGVKHDILMLYLQAGIYIIFTVVYFFARVYNDKRRLKSLVEKVE
jgi:ABC-2 type transport system permease protein